MSVKKIRILKFKVGDYVECHTYAYGTEYGVIIDITKYTYNIKVMLSDNSEYIGSSFNFNKDCVKKITEDEYRIALL